MEKTIGEVSEEIAAEMRESGIGTAKSFNQSDHEAKPETEIAVYYKPIAGGHGKLLIATRNEWDERRKRRAFIPQ